MVSRFAKILMVVCALGWAVGICNADSITIGSIQATPGQTSANLPVTVSSSSNLAGVNVRLTWASANLTATGATHGAIMHPADILDSHSPGIGQYNVVAYVPTPSGQFLANSGTAFSIQLDVAGGATVGDIYPVTFAATIVGPPDTPGSGLSDTAGNSLTHTETAGQVTIVTVLPTPTPAPTPTPTTTPGPTPTTTPGPTPTTTPGPTPTTCPELPTPTGDPTSDYVTPKLPKKSAAMLTVTSTSIIITNAANESLTLILKAKKGITAPRMLALVSTDGSFTKLQTPGSIKTVQAAKQLKNLTCTNGYAASVEAGELGIVKMTAKPKRPTFYYASLKSTSASSFNKNGKMSLVNVDLSGVILTSLDTLHQRADVSIVSKKNLDKATKTEFLSVGQISPKLMPNESPYNVCDSSILALELPKVKTAGGSILTESIVADGVTRTPCKVQANAAVFTLKGSGGTKTLVARRADIKVQGLSGPDSGQIRANTRGLTVSATGGNVEADKILSAGKIDSLSAKCFKYRDGTEFKFLGGFVGRGGVTAQAQFGDLVALTTETVMLAASGYGVEAKFEDITKVNGDTGINGHFYAGFNRGTEQGTCAGAIKQMVVQKAGSKSIPATVTPDIIGLGKVNAESAAKIKFLPKGVNDDLGFVVDTCGTSGTLQLQ